jgi:ribonuclease R
VGSVSGASTAADRRSKLLAQLRAAGGEPLSVREVMHRAKLHPGERTEVKRALRDLAREGVLIQEGKRFLVPGAAPAPAPARRGPASPRDGARPTKLAARERPGRAPSVVGTLTRHRDGYGFVARIDRGGDDVFLPPEEASKALSGDLVRVEIVPGLRGRSAGRVVEVVERRRRLTLGTYHARGRSSFVVPVDPELEGYVPVPETGLAQDGDLVKVALEPGPRITGEVAERVGEPGTPRVEVLRVAYAKGFADLFPEEVRAEAARVPDHVRPEDRAGRRDLTALPLVTIDGEDARDFDDAVHVERLPGKGRGKGGYRLVVAIADVAHYVRPGSALDAEALRRGTSVYFPAMVLPMLPERLSNGICSLNPDVERLCMVADLTLDSHGEPVAAELYDGVMRSAARCTYTEVARVLAGEQVPHRERLRERFELMAELQQKLGERRRARGAIDFDLPESKIVLDEQGRVSTIERRPRNQAHRVVEEFMLAANEAVARHFGHRELPTIYRVHGLPDEEKIDAFRELAAAHGFEVPPGPIGPKQLNALLERFRGHAQERALNQLLLRAMMQAVYSAENIGHYGLAADHYLHFTSPIRRCPDLVVHRLLKEASAGGARPAAGRRRSPAHPERSRARRGGVEGRAAGDGEGAPPPRDLDAIAALASERERAAMQAEREIAAFYAALFMHDKVGERFQGVVASVVEFGLFVELEPFFVEGLVKATDLGAGFRLDKRMHALVEPRSGRAFRIGDRLEVEVIAASPIRRQIDLALVEAGEVVRAPRPLGRGGEEAPGFAPREAFALREPGAGGPRRGGRPAARAGGRGDARSGRAVAAKAAGKKGRGGAPGRRGTKRRRR